jgi:hypothetical protein
MKWTLYPTQLLVLKPYSANQPIPSFAEIVIEGWTFVVYKPKEAGCDEHSAETPPHLLLHSAVM